MGGIFVDRFGAKHLSASSLAIPNSQHLLPNQFFAKVLYSPVHPCDIMKLNGEIPNTQLPYLAGSECSAQILSVGSGQNEQFVGKFVSMMADGCWSQYVIGCFDKAIILDNQPDLEKASCGFINPLTAYALVNIAQRMGATTVVNTAATSQVGRMIQNICEIRGIECINLVSGKEKLLRLQSTEFRSRQHFDMSDKMFETSIRGHPLYNRPMVCFDALGGKQTGELFNLLPENSTLIAYGNLSGDFAKGIDMTQPIYGNKRMEGFLLERWWTQLSVAERREAEMFLKQHYQFFEPKIHEIVGLNNFQNAYTFYEKHLHMGKILLRPN